MSCENDNLEISNEIELLKEEWLKEINVKKQEIENGKFIPSEYRIELAYRIYESGHAAELAGYLELAVEQYRRAICLVHDIEKVIKLRNNQMKIQIYVDTNDKFNNENDDLSQRESNLVKYCSNAGYYHSFSNEDSDSKILQLPDEILLHIMRWVVGANLDLYSLMLIGLVCQKFHSLSTDEQLWRLISSRLWPDCSVTDLDSYGGAWMSMVKMRPHPLFHGCYLSSTSYVRKGEATYNVVSAPFLLVRYFRVFRFRADGSVIMVTSAQDPQDIIRLISVLDQTHQISKLESVTGNYSIATGHYAIDGDTVTINLVRTCGDISSNSTSVVVKRVSKPNVIDELIKHHLSMAFRIKNSQLRPNSVFKWRSFSISSVVRNEVTVTHFDCRGDKFPAIVFSRVREFSSRIASDHL